MNICAIVIAKGQSRRIPRKNWQDFCGKPLFEWSLIQAASSKYINAHFLVTNDEDMRPIAERWGFKMVMQPDEEIERAQAEGCLGGPYSFLRGLAAAEEEGTVHLVLNFLPTSPLRKPTDIDYAIDLWCKDARTPVSSMYRPPDTAMAEVNEDGTWSQAIFDKTQKYGNAPGCVVSVCTPKQYRELCHRPDGTLAHHGNEAVLNRFRPYFIERWQDLDIDEPDQLATAAVLMEQHILKGQGEKVYTEYKKVMLSEYGYEQHAANYNRNVESNLLPWEYRNSFFNHLPVVLETLPVGPEVIGWDLVQVEVDPHDPAKLERKAIKSLRAHNAQDVSKDRLAEQEPCIIVGSGPSMNDAIPYLKDWKGGLICSTSQATTLVGCGAPPTHIVAYDVMTSQKELDAIDDWNKYRSVLVTHPGVNPSVIDYWKGRKLYFRSMDTNNFFFMNILPLAYGDIIPSQMFLFSCSIAAQMSIANALNYSPIFFVGCDFINDRYRKMWYENGEWKREAPRDKKLEGGKLDIIAANGERSNPLQVFYKRSVLAVWRIDRSQCIMTSPRSIITEMPHANIRAVIAEQGNGFESMYFTEDQIKDASELYLARFNQFMVAFEQAGVRVIESHAGENWEEDVLKYLHYLGEQTKAIRGAPVLDIEKNMARFRALKAKLAEEG